MIAPSAFCKRCGRISRGWLNRHRRCAGFLLLMKCCCDEEDACPDPVQLELSGVDAAKCDCTNLGDGTSYETDVMVVDGTYELPLVSSDETTCTYEDSFEPPDLCWIERNVYSDEDCATLDENVCETFIHIRVVLDRETQNVQEIIVTGTSQASFVDRGETFKWTGDSALGNALPNQNTCGTIASGQTVDSDGGTGTVTIP